MILMMSQQVFVCLIQNFLLKCLSQVCLHFLLRSVLKEPSDGVCGVIKHGGKQVASFQFLGGHPFRRRWEVMSFSEAGVPGRHLRRVHLFETDNDITRFVVDVSLCRQTALHPHLHCLHIVLVVLERRQRTCGGIRQTGLGLGRVPAPGPRLQLTFPDGVSSSDQLEL